jgi:hypothetical protein
MDELEHLLQVYQARPTAPASWKLDVLLDLEPLRDPRILPFLLQLLLDGQQPSEVRIRVVRHLRDARRVGEARGSVAEALTRVVADRFSPDLRLAAVLALTEFTEVAGVVSVLGALAGDRAEPPDLRYCAFTSLERPAPSSEVAILMQHLSTDHLLGGAARALLTRWQRR